MPLQVIGAFALGVIVGCNKNWILKNYPFTNPVYPYGEPFYSDTSTKQDKNKSK